jgi:flagellar biosynthesis GTPase FlhF
MRIKTFYTKTMPEALQEIKAHLGPEAVLLSTKEVPLRSGVWGRSSGFEVVAAADHEEDIDVYLRGNGNRPEDEKADSSMSASIGVQSESTLSGTYSPAALTPKNNPSPKNSVRPKKRRAGDGSDAAACKQTEEELPFKGRAPVGLYRDLVDCGVEAPLARTLLSNALELLAEESPTWG